MKKKGIRGQGKISSALNREISGGLSAKKPKKFSFLIIAIAFIAIWIFSSIYMGFKQGSIITVVLLVIFGFALMQGNQKTNESVDFKLKRKNKK